MPAPVPGPRFQGIYIPLTTPFASDGAVDWPMLAKLVGFYARQGVAGFVPCGSTGEASTLSMEEHKSVISFVCDEVRRHAGMQVIAATGANNTREAIELTRHAKRAGADACLVVTPYYVRPNLSGLLGHYAAVAEADIDLVLYNIPGRTGLNLSVENIEELVDAVPRIVGIKEATSDIGQLIELAHRYADVPGFSVLSGEDSLLFDCLAHGGRGSICAAALVFPEDVIRLYDLLAAGQLHEARALNRQLRPKMRTLFGETNPVPVKYAMHMRFGASPQVRLPLGPASTRTRESIEGLGLQREPGF